MAQPQAHRLFVTSADGTRIAVHDHGGSGPVLVAVHGFPDNHTVWDGVAAELVDRFRVVAYDVRGAGESDQPRGRAAYRMERLAEDFTAVLDAISPDAPVLLLAHDWGSMQSWEFVSDPAIAPRVAAFASISGPHLDYAGVWMQDVLRHPKGSLRQLLSSYYMIALQIPRLPERVLSLDVVERGIARVERDGREPGASQDVVRRQPQDRINGINLYRSNVLRRVLLPRPPRTEVPVLVIVPVDDPFARPDICSEAPVPFVDDLTVAEIPGSHWVVTARPDLIADQVRSYFEPRVPAPVLVKRRS